MTEKFGGTAGNIAYTLKMLGEKPLILATIGKDYHSYFEWLRVNGLDTNGIKIIQDEFTAGAYITTDKADNQITGFNPGAMKHRSDFSFPGTSGETIGLMGPGNLGDMSLRNITRQIISPASAIPVSRCLHGKPRTLLNG
jgi:adenosine kinase